MEKDRIIIRQGSRILTPRGFYKLRDALDPNGGYGMIIDGLINTGARVVEFWWILDNPDCYHASAHVIDLPAIGAAKKARCKTTDRTIRLTTAGCTAMETLFGAKLAFRDRTSMRDALIRAAKKSGLGKEGINPKMFRKCLVSWLVECRKDLGIDSVDITANMGHSRDIMIQNYLGIGFSKEDHADMIEFLKGW